MNDEIAGLIRRNTLLLVVSVLSATLAFECFVLLSSKITVIITDNEALSGLPLSLAGISTLTTSIFFGRRADKTGRRKTLALIFTFLSAGLLLSSLGMSLLNFIFFAIGSLLIGLGINFTSLASTAVSDMYSTKSRGSAIGLINASSYIGNIISGIVVGILTDIIGIVPVLMFGALLSAISITMMIAIRRDPLQIARQIREFNEDKKSQNSVEADKKVRGPKEIFKLRPIQVQFWSRVFAHAPRLFLVITIPFILPRIGYKMGSVGLLFTLMGLGMFLSSLPSGYLADRIGRKRVLLIGLTLIMLSTFITPFFTQEYGLLALAFLLIGFGFSFTGNACQTIISDITTSAERGASFGFFGIASNLGPIIFPLISGWLNAVIGFTNACIVITSLITVPITLSLVLLKERKVGVFE